MNILGQWKIKYIMSFDDDGNILWLDVDNPPADAEDSIASVKGLCLHIGSDNKIEPFIKIPPEITPEELQSAIDDGWKVVGGYIVEEAKEWKEENGKYYYTESLEESASGEVTPAWGELKLIDGMLEMGGMRLKRIPVSR